jgi:hypothetical protein
MASMQVKQWALQLTETMTVSFVEEYGRRQDTQGGRQSPLALCGCRCLERFGNEYEGKIVAHVYIVHVYRIRESPKCRPEV